MKDDNPSGKIPIINILLILINAGVFIYQLFGTPGQVQTLFFRLGFIPYELTHGVDIGPRNLVPLPFTLITSMFIHGGWFHLVGNMLYLWIFGDNIEEKLGHIKYLFFYLMRGIMGSVVHGLVNADSQVATVGASGAIAGVLGAYWLLFPSARINTLFIVFIFAKVIKLPAINVLGSWILIQVISGFAPGSHHDGVAWFAHMGGFVTGMILIIWLKKRKKCT